MKKSKVSKNALEKILNEIKDGGNISDETVQEYLDELGYVDPTTHSYKGMIRFLMKKNSKDGGNPQSVELMNKLIELNSIEKNQAQKDAAGNFDGVYSVPSPVLNLKTDKQISLENQRRYDYNKKRNSFWTPLYDFIEEMKFLFYLTVVFFIIGAIVVLIEDYFK